MAGARTQRRDLHPLRRWLRAVDRRARSRGALRPLLRLVLLRQPGVESPVGAADFSLRGGDAIWWGLPRLVGGRGGCPAVVGSWPQPFRDGYEGERPATVRGMPGRGEGMRGGARPAGSGGRQARRPLRQRPACPRRPVGEGARGTPAAGADRGGGRRRAACSPTSRRSEPAPTRSEGWTKGGGGGAEVRARRRPRRRHPPQRSAARCGSSAARRGAGVEAAAQLLDATEPARPLRGRGRRAARDAAADRSAEPVRSPLRLHAAGRGRCSRPLPAPLSPTSALW